MSVHSLTERPAGRVLGDRTDPPSTGRLTPRGQLAAAGTVLAGALVCFWALLAPPGPSWFNAKDVAAAFTTGVIAGGGALLIAHCENDVRFRKPLGIGLLLAAACHLASNFWGFSSPLQQTTILVWSVPAIGFSIAGLASRLPRSELLMSVRGLLESGLMGATLAAAVWQQAFRPFGAEPFIIYTLVLVTVTVSASLVFTLRSDDTGLRLTAFAVAALVLAAVSSLHLDLMLPRVQDPGTFWMALAALLWPPLVVGLFMANRGRPGPDGDGVAVKERLFTMLTSALVLACCTFTLAGMIRQGVDRPTLALCAVAVVLLWLREVVRAHQTHRLLSEVGAQAATDPMTGLGNRRGLEERIQGVGRRTQGPTGVITVDIDRFKDVNDLLGQTRGDALLVATANELAALARAAGGQAYRVGGDEFVLLATGGQQSTRVLAAQAAEVMTSAASRVPGAARLQLSCSVGLDGCWEHSGPRDLSTGLLRSSHAMRHAKATSARVAVFSPAMADAVARRRAVEQRLRAGLDAIDVRFQPILTLDERRVIAVEALARWYDSHLGQIPPQEFLAVAEQTGQMERVGLHLLRRALAHTRELNLAAEGIRTSVNVSTLELRVPGFVPRLLTEIAAAGLQPQDIIIEVSESVLGVRGEPVTILEELAGTGVGVVLDDFGAGYSSLALLTSLPVHGLKMDRVLTGRLPGSRADAIVSALSQLATDLGMGVVAAGVETAEQEAALQRHGLWSVQGWRYAHALDLRGLEEYLSRGRR